MRTEQGLSELYERYNNRELSRKDFEGMIFRYLRDNFTWFHLFDGDLYRWEDFLSWVYPLIARAVDRYRNVGSSFDAYIGGLIHSAAKEYRTREENHIITERVWWQAKAEEFVVYEKEIFYEPDTPEVSFPEDLSPRQLLILILKSYFFVPREWIEKAAGFIGMTSGEIEGMMDELRRRRSEADAEILALQERIQCQHYRFLAYHKRMLMTQKETAYYFKMKDRYERARKRLYSMRKRLAGMRKTASNKMIAEVMGIPRGTVDSNLAAIKKRRL